MNSLLRWYRWATAPHLHWGMCGTRFMLPVIPLLMLGFTLLAFDGRLAGLAAIGTATIMSVTFASLLLRDPWSSAATLVRRAFG